MNSDADVRGVQAVPGKIELIMGPMRSNKTAELLRRAEMRRQYAKQYVLVLKPSDDTKGGPGLVESRNPNGHARMQALEFNSADPWPVLEKIAEVEQEIGKRVECVAIDEGQFVSDLFLFARNLLDANHDVLVAGLDLDFRALPFGEMLNLSWLVNAYGGSITECMAYCTCGARALYSQRLIDGKPAAYDCPVKVPGDAYEPRCAEHFILPGRPH
ncbi:thymidine kinase [Occallatibacter savannae]|uniref:thymidine kinase n=1 Tax=Occallatibacter savannae TaxID=1002691 RepID=UPI000D68F2CE|nr:thymidine kinase [Occallatibacter savannae]